MLERAVLPKPAVASGGKIPAWLCLVLFRPNMQEMCTKYTRNMPDHVPEEERKQKVEGEKVHACRSRRNQSGSTRVCRQTAKLDVCMNARLRAGCDVYLHTTEILKKICIYCFCDAFFLASSPHSPVPVTEFLCTVRELALVPVLAEAVDCSQKLFCKASQW